MAVKIIVSDLDGTLMAPDHLTVAEATKTALLRAHDAGMRIAIATGRTLSFTANVTDQIPFVDYVICSNGACVYDRNNKEFIYSKLISPEETAEAVTLLNSLPIYYNIYLEGRIYVQKGSERFFVNPDMPSGFIEKFVASTVQCDDLLDSIKGKGAELIDVFAADPQVKNSVLDNFRSKATPSSAFDGAIALAASLHGSVPFAIANESPAIRSIGASFSASPKAIASLGVMPSRSHIPSSAAPLLTPPAVAEFTPGAAEAIS